jgi:hypothetical protein
MYYSGVLAPINHPNPTPKKIPISNNNPKKSSRIGNLKLLHST